MNVRYFLAKKICKYLPPIISQVVRNSIISTKIGEGLNEKFTKRSLTGSKFIGSTSDFHAFKFSIHGYFDWRNVVLAKTILRFKKGDIIEVGANIGTETVSFCDIANSHNVKVLAFEPLPSNVGALIINKNVNNFKNLQIFGCLVSNYTGKSYFNVPVGNNSGSGHITNSNISKDAQEFDVVTLDSKIECKNISLIAIDVEGFEYQVLKGGYQILQKQKPVIILEVNKKYLEKRGEINLLDFHNFLSELGYKCFYIGKIGLKRVEIQNFKNKVNKNWVCLNEDDIALFSHLNKAILWNAFNPLIYYKQV